MERNRDSRRGTVSAMNGGLSRRRQRSSSLRDSPEEDGVLEMAETARLRDRGSKKDRDRDRERSSRSKRRRGERMLQGNSRDEGDESSEESLDDEEDEEDDDVAVAIRLPPTPPPPPNPATSSSSLQQNHHHSHPHHHHNGNHQQQRKSLQPAKVGRAPTPSAWKADDMIGVSVPRKARSASTKRSHECWVSGGVGCGSGSGSGGGGGGGEHIPRQPSTSPSRLSPASTSQISPSSSNASSLKKKMRPMGGGTKHRPPKISKSSPLIQDDIEIEVAEVLYGMTRHLQPPTRPETLKPDTKEANGVSAGEAKSSVSSPNSIFPSPLASQPSILPPSNSSSNPSSMPIVAPKRKRPRPVKFEDESPTSPVGLASLPSTSVSSASKMEAEHQTKAEASSPRLEKNTASSAIENGGGSTDAAVPQLAATPMDATQESAKSQAKNLVPDSKPENGQSDDGDRTDCKDEFNSELKETPSAVLDANFSDAVATKSASASDVPREEKFCIDLMAPPPGKLSPDRDDMCDLDADHKSQELKIDLMSKVNVEKKEEKVAEKTAQAEDPPIEDRKADKSSLQGEFDLKKQVGKERTLDRQIDLEKLERHGSQLQFLKQTLKAPKAETKHDKPAPSTSLPVPMPIPGWPGNYPSFGYVGQVPTLPAVVPMDGTSGPSSNPQPPSIYPQLPPRTKRCATHLYIAHSITYHQRLAKMSAFWPAAGAAGTTPVFGAKPPYNLNVVPPADAALFGNSVLERNMGPLQDSKGTPLVASFSGHPSKERMPSTTSANAEATQRKQLLQQQTSQSGSANMLQGPAFLFSINQQQAAAAAAAMAAAAAAGRSGVTKSTPVVGNGGTPPVASNSTAAASGTGGQPATMNLSFAGLPPSEAQYLILQNSAYPFPIPAHVAGAQYRGASPGQAVTFFNGPFYSSQMLHPAQQQQQPPPLPPPGPQQASNNQQGHQKSSPSSGLSSSQKHPPQSQRALGGGGGGTGGSSLTFPAMDQRLPPHQAWQQEREKGSEDSPSATGDCRVSQAQKNFYGHNFAMPFHPQNFALMSGAAAAAALGGGGQSDKQPQQQHSPQQNQTVKLDLTSSQAFAMPFASFNGVTAAPPGLDFSSLAQNHTLFQSLPEAARHAYNQKTTAAVAAAAAAVVQAAQQKKTYPQIAEDGKSVGRDAGDSNVQGEDERKMSTTNKAPSSGSKHALSFSRSDGDTAAPSMLGNSVVDSSSRTLNLIAAPANHSSSANATTTSAAGATASIASLQKFRVQQQPLQFQKQPERLHLPQIGSSGTKLSASSSNALPYSEHLPGGSAATKFPQPLSGFPQSVVQSSGSAQSPQWKGPAVRSPTPAPASASASAAKNTHLLQQQQPGRTQQNIILQQQGRPRQQPLSTQSHQNQISFGGNSIKSAPAGGQHGQQLIGVTVIPSSSATSAAMAIGSPQNSVSKGSTGSPRASTGGKPGSTTAASPLPQQQSTKSPASSSSQKPSQTSNQNVTSILGQPRTAPAHCSSGKPQQQQQQQPQQQHKQPYQQAHLFFSNAYMQAQPPSSNAAAAAGNYLRRHSEQPPSQHHQQLHQHQQNSMPPGTAGMLALCSSALNLAGVPATSDPAKAVAAATNGMKSMPPAGLLHAAQLAAAASGATHSLIPASFPYMSMSMPPVSVKSAADQKPAAGNDNLHACWQPEKR